MSPVGQEFKYIQDTVLKGEPFSGKCEDILVSLIGCKAAILTKSATASLEMAAILLDIKDGDEVIMPSFTFVSTANAVCLRGAKPKFVDIRSDTLNIDENKIEAEIGEKTKAIFPVHYAGFACEMSSINQIAKKYDLAVVEDAAHGIGSKYKGVSLGSFGQLSALSFHETKNIGCGEGGALLINDDQFLERAVILRDKGTNRQKFLNGLADKYSWIDIGSSYGISEILSSFLFAQLENLDRVTKRRRQIWSAYRSGFSKLDEMGLITLPTTPDNCEGNAHIFYLVTNSAVERQSLLSHLNSRGIQAVFHYVPLHSAPMGKKLGYSDGDFPVTESISSRLIRLPIFYSMSDEMVKFVIKSVYESHGLTGDFGS